MPRLIEIRTYRLKPNTIDDFHNIMKNNAVSLLIEKGIDVVAFGRSDHEEETYFLIRSFTDRVALEKEQNEFYGSDAWKLGPRQSVVDLIETYMNTLIWTSEESLESMRKLNEFTI
jgi:hypothetical protein